MAYIGRQLARGENKLFDDISSSFNGSTTTFTLAVSSVATATATPYQLFVSLGGVMQKPNTDFTTAGNQITFTTAPAAGLSCWIMMQGDTIDQAAIPDSSVTPSKISGSNFAFSGDLRLKDADGSHYVGFASPTTVASNKVWTLPAADGTASQYLQTNGSGVLSWSTVSVGGATGIDFNDNVKARWGTGNDLEIFHDGTDDKIMSGSTNSLIIATKYGRIMNAAGNETQAKFYENGAVELYYDNAKKFETTNTGVSITGALTVSTNATITGDLTVSGTTTTINTQTLDVEDKNVVIGKVSSPSDTTADGGGWTLKGATDKTFNWVNATDAWTSSEHIHLLDNKKLFVGGASGTTDGLEIYHDSNNSFIKDSGTGGLFIQGSGGGAGITLEDPDGNNFIVCIDEGTGGTVELYKGGSKKLETTTGGINVTGAINVNGAALSTAPTVTGTLTGSVSAEGAVAVKSDGTLEPISTSISLNNPPTSTVEHQVSRSDSGGMYNTVTSFSCIYDPVNNKYIIGYGSSNNAAQLYRVGTPSTDGKTVTWDTASASYGTGWEAYDAFYDTTSNKIVHVGKTNQNKWQYRVQDYTTVGSLTDITSSRNPTDSVACQAGNKVVSFVKVGNYGYARVGTVSTSNQTISWGSEYTIANNLNSLRDLCIAYDTTHSRLVFGYTYYAGSSYFGALKVATVSQTANDNTMTVGSQTNMVTSTTFCAETSICHNPSDEKMYIVFRDQSSGLSENGRLTGTVGTVADSGNSITMSGSKTDAGSGNVQKSSMRLKLIYNPNITRVCLFWTDVAGVTNTSKAGTITSNGSNVFSFETSFNTSLIGKETDPHVGQTMFGVDYNSTAKIIIGVVPNDESSKSLSFFASDHGGPVSNSNKFIGFADAGYTNGQTATVKVVGNTTTQSSLTPGTTYYIQDNGTLGTSAQLHDVKAGIALTSTKLLVKPA